MTTVRLGLVQMALASASDEAPAKIAAAMTAAHVARMEEAARAGVQVIAFQELFNQPFFCAGEDPAWRDAAEAVPDGPTISVVREAARRLGMVVVAPIYERDDRGRLFNSAVVIDADGSHAGTYRKVHIPLVTCSEKLYFEAGDLGFPVFHTAYLKLGVCICYDRHFPEAWRALALGGADLIVNPSSTPTAPEMWKVEQRAAAMMNSCFVGCINRVGIEAPWNLGRFYGSSYVAGPRGEMLAEAAADEDALVVADLDLDQLAETRTYFRFMSERRPDAYGALLGPTT